MNINDYQKEAMKFINPKLKGQDVLINSVMGLCGEAGETIDLVKKHLHQGHELNIDKFKEELGDIAWYLAEACSAINVSLEEVLEGNIKKLSSRYPDGFSVDKSIHRKL